MMLRSIQKYASLSHMCRRSFSLGGLKVSQTSSPQLLDATLLRGDAYYAGEWHRGVEEERIEVHNPATDAVIGSVANMTESDTNSAIDAAAEAQQLWAAELPAKRAELIRTWGQLMIENQKDLATIMTIEQGKPLAEAAGEIGYAASFLSFYADSTQRVFGEVLPPYQTTTRAYTLRQPVGVVAAITPWNFPAAMITRKAGPALAAGCSIVIKPSELTPYSALALCELAERAGIPNGVVNVVTGHAQPIGKAFMDSDIVRKVSFTGSTKVGKLLLAQSADTVKRTSMELGGNAPFIVFEDADVDKAVQGLMFAKFRNAGQTCVSANRIFVHEKVYAEFAEKLTKAVQALRVGPGWEQGVVVGPVINSAAATKIQAHVDNGVKMGGEILCGGSSTKQFVSPTVLINATSNMDCFSQETFGPLAALFSFANESEVVAAANDSRAGLASYFYTRDIARMYRVTETLQYGMVACNQGAVSHATAPFGGIKESGLGREGGREGIDEYLQTKTCHVGL